MKRFKTLRFMLPALLLLSLIVPAAGVSATNGTITFKTYLPTNRSACGPSAYDSFTNPASGWVVEDTPAYSAAYLNGEYQILVKQVGQVAFNWMDYGAINYRYEADARPVSHLDGNLGLVFSGSLTTGFYLFQINNNLYSLYKISMGSWVWTPLVAWTNSPAIKTGFVTNHLEVVRQDANITLYVNHQLLTTVSDSTYSGTMLGLEAATNTVANFDGRLTNLLVYTGACIAP